MGIKRKVQERNCAIVVAARRRRGRLICESRERPWRRRRISRNGNTQALPLSSNLRHLRTPAGPAGIYGKLSSRRRKFARASRLSIGNERNESKISDTRLRSRGCRPFREAEFSWACEFISFAKWPNWNRRIRGEYLSFAEALIRDYSFPSFVTSRIRGNSPAVKMILVWLLSRVPQARDASR
jgi:hypothetical protein